MPKEFCSHLDQINDVTPNGTGCEECLKIGSEWVHLRVCMICGHVGCCDESPNRHARTHARSTNHPIIASYEPDEDWLYCFPDDVAFEIEGGPNFVHP